MSNLELQGDIKGFNVSVHVILVGHDRATPSQIGALLERIESVVYEWDEGIE